MGAAGQAFHNAPHYLQVGPPGACTGCSLLLLPLMRSSLLVEPGAGGGEACPSVGCRPAPGAPCLLAWLTCCQLAAPGSDQPRRPRRRPPCPPSAAGLGRPPGGALARQPAAQHLEAVHAAGGGHRQAGRAGGVPGLGATARRQAACEPPPGAAARLHGACASPWWLTRLARTGLPAAARLVPPHPPPPPDTPHHTTPHTLQALAHTLVISYRYNTGYDANTQVRRPSTDPWPTALQLPRRPPLHACSPSARNTRPPARLLRSQAPCHLNPTTTLPPNPNPNPTPNAAARRGDRHRQHPPHAARVWPRAGRRSQHVLGRLCHPGQGVGQHGRADRGQPARRRHQPHAARQRVPLHHSRLRVPVASQEGGAAGRGAVGALGLRQQLCLKARMHAAGEVGSIGSLWRLAATVQRVKVTIACTERGRRVDLIAFAIARIANSRVHESCG
jgi:hypothetical protein